MEPGPAQLTFEETPDPLPPRRRWEWLWTLLIVGLLAIEGAAIYWWVFYRPDPMEAIEESIQHAATRYDVAPDLIRAIIWQESRFNPNARGKAGEIGLMQLMNAAAQEWADSAKISPWDHEMVIDPGTNTLAGTYYLRKMLDRYDHTDNPLPYALAAYNAGSGNVLKWNKGIAVTNSSAFFKNIDYPGTKKYVHSVMSRFAHYSTNRVDR